jgi:hypothetical protein
VGTVHHTSHKKNGGPICIPRSCAADSSRLQRCEYARALLRRAMAALDPPFGGSNPPAPASQSGLHYPISGCVRTADIAAG